MKPFPLTAQTTYSDLLARLQDDSIAVLEGTPTSRQRGGRSYWYLQRRAGDKVLETYIGSDSPELRERIERTRKAAQDSKARERERGKLVRMLRQAGYPTTDAQTGKVLYALARTGAFRLRAVLVGSHAFNCYPAVLGRPLPTMFARTEDIDVAQSQPISIALDDALTPDFEAVLQTIESFTPRPSPRDYAKASARRGESGAVVELLTTRNKPEEGLVELPALGAYAQPLPFMDYLIHQPMPAALLYRYGVLVNVPQPARYAVHKMIVAARRLAKDTDKVAKDIAQAADLIEVLADHQPEELEAALEDACRRGAKWRKALTQGIKKLPNHAVVWLQSAAGDGLIKL